MLKYCGYIVGKEITCEQMERLFNLLHAEFSNGQLVMLTNENLRAFAEECKEEWRY